MSASLLGDVLKVDLTTGEIEKWPFTPELSAEYIGARGYNAKLLWEMVPKGADPLGPENILMFGVGPLTSTSAPSSGRTSITAKSPATGLYLKVSMGGAWGGEFRFTGHSHLVFTGKAEHPVYLWIDDEKVEIRDARQLWGKDVRETEHLIQEELGDINVKVTCIGQAGENLVKFAAIMCSNYNAGARGGIGAVMGSKNLKAVAVRGSMPVKVAEPKKFHNHIAQSWELFNAQSGVLNTHLYGTSGGVPAVNEMNVFPTRNFQDSYFPEAEKISGQYLSDAGFLKRRVGCYSCPMSCHRYAEVNEGKHAGSYTGGPEYETFGALGAGVGMSDTATVIRANELCNLYGLDTISTGNVIQWLMECHQRELEFDHDGLDLSWGNGDTVVELIHRIAHRKGVGDLLAEGVKIAAEKTGQESEDRAIQAKGLEQSRVETRAAFSYALAFMVNPRGPDHLMTETLAEFGLAPEMIEVIEKATGDKKYASSYLTEKRPEIVRWHEDTYAITDGLGLCAFTSTAQYYMTPELMADLWSAAIGIPIDEESAMNLGRKVVVMERCFNAREGATRADDLLPKRLMTEEMTDPPGKVGINSLEVMDPMLDQYYSMHGWNVDNGRPTRKVLEDLNMGSWADELEKLGYLGQSE